MPGKAKVQREQMIMGALLLVFAVILARSLKQLGLLGKQPSAAAQKTVDAVEPEAPATTMKSAARDYRENFEPKTEAVKKDQKPAPAPGVAYTSQNLRDPLVSLLPKPKPPSPAAVNKPKVQAAEKPPAPLPPLMVKGLMWGGSKPQAVINGQLYSVGEVVDGATVKAIAADGVTFEFNGQTIQLGITNAVGKAASAARPYSYSRR